LKIGGNFKGACKNTSFSAFPSQEIVTSLNAGCSALYV
jgi:hypothetical protein